MKEKFTKLKEKSFTILELCQGYTIAEEKEVIIPLVVMKSVIHNSHKIVKKHTFIDHNCFGSPFLSRGVCY